MFKGAAVKVVRRMRVQKSQCEEKVGQLVSIYEGLRWICLFHRWVGLSYVHGLCRGDHTRLGNRFWSPLTFWNFSVTGLVCVLVFLQMDEVWDSFSGKTPDCFSRVILLVMLVTTAVCVLTTGVMALLTVRALPPFMRECCETETRLNLSTYGKYSILQFARLTVLLSLIIGLASGAATFLIEYLKVGACWELLVRSLLATVIRLSSLTFAQPLMLYCHAFKTYYRHISDQIEAVGRSECDLGDCSGPSQLRKAHQDFVRVSRLVSQLDDLFSPVLLVNFCGSFFICCCCVYFFATNTGADLLYVETWLNFVAGLSILAFPAVLAGWMTQEV